VRLGKERDTKMRFRIRFETAVLVCMLLGGSSSALAQQKGQWVPGQFGLNAGVIPDPGVTYANLALNYSARPFNWPQRQRCFSYYWDLFVLGGREHPLLRAET
jgi:hypothetical protein